MEKFFVQHKFNGKWVSILDGMGEPYCFKDVESTEVCDSLNAHGVKARVLMVTEKGKEYVVWPAKCKNIKE